MAGKFEEGQYHLDPSIPVVIIPNLLRVTAPEVIYEAHKIGAIYKDGDEVFIVVQFPNQRAFQCHERAFEGRLRTAQTHAKGNAKIPTPSS